MSETNIVRRRERSGTETQAKSSVLMDAELGVITDVKKLVVGDGNKKGGYALTPDNIVAVWPDQTDAGSPLSLAWWIKKAGGAETKLRLTAGAYNIQDDLTVPSNIYLDIDKGAVINIAAGKTLTLNCEIGADVQPVFSGGGTAVETYARRKAGDGTVQETALTRDVRKKLKKHYATAAALKNDSALLEIGAVVEILGYNEQGDGRGGTYVIAENPGYYRDEDDVIYFSQNLIAKKTNPGAVMPNPYNPVVSPPDEATQGDMIACIQSYMQNQGKLYYGNDYVGSNATNVIENGLSEGKYQIDCSTFVYLVTKGIFFENSVYNGKEKNTGLEWGYRWAGEEAYFYSTAINQQRLLANDAAYYCYERGYTFKPDENWQNVDTGDIIFFTYEGQHIFVWRDVSHCAIVLGVDNNGVKIVEVPAGEGDVIQTSYLSKSRKNTVLCCARLPYGRRRQYYNIGITDKTTLYQYLADIWSIMPGRKIVQINVDATTMPETEDTPFAQNHFFVEIYKFSDVRGWYKFRSYARGVMPGSIFDVIIPIRLFDVTAEQLQTAPKYAYNVTVL